MRVELLLLSLSQGSECLAPRAATAAATLVKEDAVEELPEPWSQSSMEDPLSGLLGLRTILAWLGWRSPQGDGVLRALSRCGPAPHGDGVPCNTDIPSHPSTIQITFHSIKEKDVRVGSPT